jgi:hypothetical protein
MDTADERAVSLAGCLEDGSARAVVDGNRQTKEAKMIQATRGLKEQIISRLPGGPASTCINWFARLAV